ncbi:MAG: ATP-grasp domain-containing protein [Mariprofundaceae bacterium]|nr:ATP-grasp domain-containing protein [Mariprofundaceae bacterium]
MRNPISISQNDFQHMFSFAKKMQELILNPDYQASSSATGSAAKTPNYQSILMGYDFHLQDGLPQLIEINNNAGGLYLSQQKDWLDQPQLGQAESTLPQRILKMFEPEWQTIVIMDEDPQQQFMYSEIQAYAQLLRDDGRQVFILDPSQIKLHQDGHLSYQEHTIDMIYNRHTDFYLETTAMQHIKSAYLSNQVVLNPHPQSYDLLGDKGRMVDWHRPDFLEQFISQPQADAVRAIIPMTKYVQDQDQDQLWKERKQWVFKPTASHAGKGVVLGKSITRKRFAETNQPNMIMQAFIPPAKVTMNDISYKSDIRLYMHGQTLVAIAGRIYQGMLTNFRTEGSGFVPLEIEA